MIEFSTLRLSGVLKAFVDREVLPETGIDPSAFWAGVADIFARFAPRNRMLLAKRSEMQSKIDAWHQERGQQPFEIEPYIAFLRRIDYLLPEPAPFSIDLRNVDSEVSLSAGPQLVVPMLNARFLLNAANARWGSLYDALYGTDVIPGTRELNGYDPVRGAKVVAWAKAFLDQSVPLASGSWTDLTDPEGRIELRDNTQYVGRSARARLFRHHGLHIEVVFDRSHPVGRDDPAGIADVILESALTTICDLEDSVAAVDAEDKVCGYRNWLGLMRGDLEDTFERRVEP
jgi:malate synthase